MTSTCLQRCLWTHTREVIAECTSHMSFFTKRAFEVCLLAIEENMVSDSFKISENHFVMAAGEDNFGCRLLNPF